MSATARPSQNERVLRALRAGPVTQGDFLPPVIDGGATISRVGARIHDLKERGHRIEVAGRDEHGCAIYKLARDNSAPRYTNAAEATGDSDGRDASAPRPSHDPLDYAHRQTCDWCADHYADLAADARDEAA